MKLRIKLVSRIKTSYCRSCGERIGAHEKRLRVIDQDRVIHGTYCLGCETEAERHLIREEVEERDECLETRHLSWQDAEDYLRNLD